MWFACLLPVAHVHITSPDANMYIYRQLGLFPTLPHSPTPNIMYYGMTLVCAQVHAHLPMEFLECIQRLYLIQHSVMTTYYYTVGSPVTAAQQTLG